ncbi:hypothetical protein GC101_14655 [Paenibacillus sp. LMG 31459]|uniref:Uncharacterized protein n=1 Tax=Paenibacillus phytohabitans TaxID=2654978 RepID=A0ABX1YIA5_9BACL|nr:hypothetical protein [Paenibacillus phytohabitans]NOU80109.1 hypothetical protein [Paenibacillus phytohabitans]
MKKDAISTGLFIAIGFLCVAIVIAILIPVVRDVIDDADDNRPLIPAVSLVEPSGSGEAAVTYTIVPPLV